MRFCCLASGSEGNCTLVESSEEGETLRILVDCGISYSLLKRKLLNRGILPEEIHGVFGATVDLGLALLAAVSLNLGCCQPFDANRHKCFMHGSKSAWLNDCHDVLHSQSFLICCHPWEGRAAGVSRTTADGLPSLSAGRW